MTKLIMELYSVNQWAVNSWSNNIGLWWLLWGITIGGFSLCNENAWITAIYNDRSYDNKFYDNGFIDWQRLISHLIKEKRMIIDFALKAETIWELQTKIDELKAKTSGEKNWYVLFTIPVWDDIRVLRVIVEDITFNTDWLVTTVQSGKMSFIAVDPPRFYSYNPSTKYYIGIENDFTWQINNNGNAKTYPVYYIVFNEASWVTEFTLTLNWYPLTVTSNISTGDLIVIATDPYSLLATTWVYKNNVAIDFDWQLTTPLNSFYNWFNNIERECNGTYNADFTILYHQIRE